MFKDIAQLLLGAGQQTPNPKVFGALGCGVDLHSLNHGTGPLGSSETGITHREDVRYGFRGLRFRVYGSQKCRYNLGSMLAKAQKSAKSLQKVRKKGTPCGETLPWERFRGP